MREVLWFVALLSVIFGLILTWNDGNVGEGLNFVLAGLVFAHLSAPPNLDLRNRG